MKNTDTIITKITDLHQQLATVRKQKESASPEQLEMLNKEEEQLEQDIITVAGMTDPAAIDAVTTKLIELEASKSRLAELNETLNKAETEQTSTKLSAIGVTDKVRKKSLADSLKRIAITITGIEGQIKAEKNNCSEIEVQLAELRQKMVAAETARQHGMSARDVFENHHIHYVVFEQKWYSVDGQHDRMNLKIKESPVAVIRDLIYYAANTDIENERELKALAKSYDRIRLHAVRDFDKERKDVYNQMNDIRKFWLKPDDSAEPHPAFRILMESVAGGSAPYADQLERYAAYRYCHPEDVMIPNIDSCAIGGTGRETYFNLFNMIFTPVCTGIAGTETFNGTHNSDLYGKMIIKIDEKSDKSVPVDTLKELTGGLTYRHRAMQTDPRDAKRLFSFLIFRNGFTTTVQLAGTGSSGEDRRWEPVIARVNLTRHVAKYLGLTKDINEPLTTEHEREATKVIKQWQAAYWRNEGEVAKWLAHIIKKHKAKEMTEFTPLHGVYYHMMVERQARGLDGFMPKVFALMKNTTVFAVKDMWELYKTCESAKISKGTFKIKLQEWLNSKQGWDCEANIANFYTDDSLDRLKRSNSEFIMNKLAPPEHAVFDLSEFIDPDSEDDKGNIVGMKISPFSIRDELK